MNKWLPNKPMIKVDYYSKRNIIHNVPFKSANYDPKDIASKIDEFANKSIKEYSLMGKNWSEQNCWKVLKPKYLKIIREVYEN